MDGSHFLAFRAAGGAVGRTQRRHHQAPAAVCRRRSGYRADICERHGRASAEKGRTYGGVCGAWRTAFAVHETISAGKGGELREISGTAGICCGSALCGIGRIPPDLCAGKKRRDKGCVHRQRGRGYWNSGGVGSIISPALWENAEIAEEYVERLAIKGVLC